MRKPEAPCKGCEKRRLGCHAECEKYQAFLRDNDARYKIVRENKDKSRAIEDVGVRRSVRAKKAAGMVKK